MPNASAVFPFAKGGEVGIIAKPDRYIEAFCRQLDDIQTVPVGNIRHLVHHAALRVEGSSHAQGNAPHRAVFRPDRGNQIEQPLKRRLFPSCRDRLNHPGFKSLWRIKGRTQLRTADIHRYIIHSILAAFFLR